MFTKGGGVLAQSLSILALVPSLGVTAILIMVPVILSLVLFLRYGTETRGMDLRHLEAGNRPSSPVATATLAGEAGLAREAGIGRSA